MADSNVIRLDGYVSQVSGIGDALRDKRESVAFVPENLSRADAEKLWRGNDLAARVVEKLPDEMTREGYECVIPGVKEQQGLAVNAWLDEQDYLAPIHEALCLARALGGSYLLLGVDDGQSSMAEPLNLERVQALQWLTVLGPNECTPARWYEDPAARGFGGPMTYRVNGSGTRLVNAAGQPLLSGVEVHETRLIRFCGTRLTRAATRQNGGIGDSVLVRVHRKLRDYDMGWEATALLLQEFSLAKLKVKGLAALMRSGDEDAAVNRAAALALSKSVARVMVMDSEEEFTRDTTNLGGIPQVLAEFATRVAAAADMPATVLLGISPAGLNATGQSDIRLWYDRVQAGQRKQVRPALNTILTCAFRAKNGPTQGKEPPNWSVVFKPLQRMTEGETAELRLKVAQADQIYMQNQAVSPEEVALSRFGGRGWSMETTIDVASRKELGGQEELEPGTEGTDQELEKKDPEAVDPSTALNGAQVASLLEVVGQVARGEIPRETGLQIITQSFPISTQEADRLLGEVGKGFKPNAPPAAPAPFGAKPPAGVQTPAAEDGEGEDGEEDPPGSSGSGAE